MTRPEAPRQPLEELRYALAEADSEPPPETLRSRVLDAAHAARRPGVATGTGPPITAAEAYRRSVVSLDSVLSELSAAEWHQSALRDLDIQGLVGHLIGVERQLLAAIGIAAEVATSTDHVASTQDAALAQAGRPPSQTHAEWRELTARTVEHAAALDPEARQRPVTLHRFTIPLERLLVVRAFETWTHEEDIRRATGRALSPPDPARLRLMTELAVSALPFGLANIDRPQPGRTARIILTGPGGGTWQAALDRGTPGSTDVRIIADAVSFCRLAANRVTQAELDCRILGDAVLAADVLAGARTLALD
jgi:uncharacterized protein (TIGR03083 family)